MADNSIVAPSAAELTMLRQRVTEAVSEGSPGPVKALLQHRFTKFGWTAGKPSTRYSVFLWVGMVLWAMRFAHVPLGGGEGTRTLGLYIANVALYQLSYTPRCA